MHFVAAVERQHHFIVVEHGRTRPFIMLCPQICKPLMQVSLTVHAEQLSVTPHSAPNSCSDAAVFLRTLRGVSFRPLRG
jgi:hypothetical protein